YGAIALNDSTSNSGQPYRIAFDDSISAGRMVVFDLVLNGSGGYQDTLPLYLRVGAKQEGDHFTHTAGQVQFTVSNYGIYGLGQGSASDSGGVGFIYLPDNQSYLYEMAFMIASDSDHVSDAARNMLPYSNDIDLQVAPGGGLKAYAPSFYAEERTISVFNDNGSCQPLGVEIRQSTFAYKEDIEDQFVIMAYEVKNTSDSSLSGLRVALYADWDFPYGADMVGFDGDLDLGYMYANDGSAIRGIAVLNSEGTASYRSIDGAAWTRDGFAKSEKWQFMSEGFVDTASVYAKDHSHLIATGPFDLAPGQVDTAAFAIIGVDSLAEFDVVVPRAVLRFNDFMVSAENPQDPGGIPDKFELFANYPNPFNPATTIEFALDKQQAVRLEVFNILGRKVATLVDDVLDAGYHKVVWDSSAEKVSSGVYFYRLKGENQAVSRKMLLLK
ncbi:MAG: T9SS type A sorting domain-containing protein, partial [candidate division Zixibacteria bacterium]|nr:T9SS type A sorting domain-containing protein [candidate division Zixibacteria bacterium]